MPSQFPPDAPAPPPSHAATVFRKKWKLLWAIGGGAILLILLSVVSAPLFLRGCGRSDVADAVNNARQIGLALFEFQTEYGKFPDADTAAEVRLRMQTDLDLNGSSSNAFFRQLLGAGIAQSETMFYAKVGGCRKPDNDFSRTEAMLRGECGFTYFLGAKSTDNPNRPLVVTPMIPGTDRFDKLKGFDGKAVILWNDNSAGFLPIDKDGHVIIDGRNMMDPDHPIWEGHAPTIAWPDLNQ